ncbi:reverse transcriptase domain-containing protein [Paludisphaera mucosa]|uniref:RNA-directed DNA polymerase n=1 Tax=Paludisphaera mucosa TaxID=3030827 RepID=A0ABT6F6E9_9BACT|nr:reverse transcriptase domain-containing protein [Paludisphaera mucosa]MDG3003089.1 reverse transcriptase domain-containing protein [Paludisphaera mucosa]
MIARDAGPSDQTARLAAILDIDDEELRGVRLGPRYHYRPFTISKPDGRERRLLAPSPSLKRLQRRLLDGYLVSLPIHPAATAFYPGATTVLNAIPHARSALIATVDLRDFFETTQSARVRGCFRAHGWRGEALQVLMRLCTSREGLPQGAPTSPCLSNLVNVQLDDRLLRLVRRSRGIYTRYGDDLTFSWPHDRMPSGFRRSVEDALGDSGYEVQPRKGWQVGEARERPRVTGLVLAGDGRLRVPWELKWRTAVLRWRSWWTRDPVDLARLQGRREYQRMVEQVPEAIRHRRSAHDGR